MKSYIVIVFLLILNRSQAQKYGDTTISKQTLDSLLAAFNSLKGAFEKQSYRFRLQTETSKIDTSNFRQDSTIITYWTREGMPLKRVEQFKSKGCILLETEKFYNRGGFLQYAETWSLSCGTPQNTDPDIKMFTGMQTELERFEYDSLGRVKLRVLWYYTIGARRYSYSYSVDNKPTIKKTYIRQNDFWR
jgi:hypothetical protein